jgi:hypothetical protein
LGEIYLNLYSPNKAAGEVLYTHPASLEDARGHTRGSQHFILAGNKETTLGRANHRGKDV